MHLFSLKQLCLNYNCSVSYRLVYSILAEGCHEWRGQVAKTTLSPWL